MSRTFFDDLAVGDVSQIPRRKTRLRTEIRLNFKTGKLKIRKFWPSDPLIEKPPPQKKLVNVVS